MPAKQLPIVELSQMTPGQEADLFVLMSVKEELKTRDGKPYFRVGFRDAAREVVFPVWGDSTWAIECREGWQPGQFYKLRAEYRESNYGPQLEIRKIRPVNDADRADGFDSAMCQPRSRFDAVTMFNELVSIAREQIANAPLSALVVGILEANRETLLTLPAASRNHHAFAAGFLEHVLSVTRTAVYLAGKYADYYSTLNPTLRADLVVAGAILHDIGKVRELVQHPAGADYSPEGHLIGHILQGRDIVREASATHPLDPDTLLRLEHIIVSHQRLAEWGSPKPPMTPEALIVHYADDLDAKFHMMAAILRDDQTPGPTTSKKNVLMQQVFRGLEGA